MSTLKIWQNGQSRQVSFEGTPLLQSVLSEAGCAMDLPCGGRGVCGKCAVTLKGQVSEPNKAEQEAGTRLSCQAHLLGDAEVILPDTEQNRIEGAEGKLHVGRPLAAGIGAAVDIGTTTIVLNLYRMFDGSVLAAESCMNPQRTISADVMGRIGASLDGQGELLQQLVKEAIFRLLDRACTSVGLTRQAVEIMVIAGNTTMLYLLTGKNPEALSHAPFEADCLFGEDDRLDGIRVFYPRCMNAFVGADITCAVLASGMEEKEETSLLCDIGTNGEIALWKDGKLYVTSTAAGPAFEGAGISCGCGSVTGAIDRVWTENGKIMAHTIGDAPAVGICGSGLIDAVAAYLETELVDETGASEEDQLPLRDDVFLIPKDIRQVQLAKAAIAAGIQTLLELAKVKTEEIRTLYIAGGFGSHLNVASAAAIGLIPEELADRVITIGNGSLTGAASILLDGANRDLSQKLAAGSSHINLGGNSNFNEHYMDQMFFE